MPGTSSLGKLIDPLELMSRLPADRPIVFVFGAIARGEYKADYVEETYSFSQFPVRLRCLAPWRVRKGRGWGWGGGGSVGWGSLPGGLAGGSRGECGRERAAWRPRHVLRLP